MTSPAALAAGGLIVASEINGAINFHAPLYKEASSDETLNNVGVYQDDDELFVSVAASCKYFVNMYIKYHSGTTPDFAARWSVPASTTMDWVSHSLASG